MFFFHTTHHKRNATQTTFQFEKEVNQVFLIENLLP